MGGILVACRHCHTARTRLQQVAGGTYAPARVAAAADHPDHLDPHLPGRGAPVARARGRGRQRAGPVAHSPKIARSVARSRLIKGALLSSKASRISASQSRSCADTGADEVPQFVVDSLTKDATLLVPNEVVKTVAEKSIGAVVSGDTVVLPGVMSRKKQIIPVLTL